MYNFYTKFVITLEICKQFFENYVNEIVTFFTS